MDEYQLKNFLKFAPARLGLVPKKHLFIHIPKNGGMSIRHTPELQGKVVLANRRRLKSKSYANLLLETMNASGDHPGYEHARLRDIDISARAGCQPFAIVRNPWARVVSRFTFALQVMNSGNAVGDYASRDFEAFLEERHVWGGKDFYWHRAVRGWTQQIEYVRDDTGCIAAGILRLEKMDEEYNKYFQINKPLKKRNVTLNRSRNYKNYYNSKTIQAVADWHEDDIETFGFDFDGPAIKNTLFSKN